MSATDSHRLPSSTVFERRAEIEAHPDPELYQTLTRMVKDDGIRFVVSLGGGSVPGVCGNLALTSLITELGLREHVDEVWGTSAGAAVGGSWASGCTSERFKQVVSGLARPGAVSVDWMRAARALLFRRFGARVPDGLINPEALQQAVMSTTAVDTFEECPIPFRCVACSDDGQARRKVFRRGPLLPAIYASMSLPGIFEPQPPLDGEEHGYYDGGLVEKTPLLSAIAEHNRKGDGRKLLILATHFSNDAKRVPAHGFINRFLHSIYALEDLAWNYQLAEARAWKGVEVLVLSPEIDDPELLNFSKIDRNFLLSREVFAADLQDSRIGLGFGQE